MINGTLLGVSHISASLHSVSIAYGEVQRITQDGLRRESEDGRRSASTVWGTILDNGIEGTLSGTSILVGVLSGMSGIYAQKARSTMDGQVRITEDGDVRMSRSDVPSIYLEGELSCQKTLEGELTIPLSADGVPYGGEYTVEPGQQAVTLPTRGKVLARDITIQPIPSNYGLVTWNGTTLTIS